MKKYWYKWLLFLLIATICQVVSKFYFPIPEIIKLEFSTTAQLMLTNILSIAPTPEGCFYILKYNTIIDYVFLISFTLLLFYSCKILLTSFNYPMNSWIIVLCLATGFFDIIENYFLLKSAILNIANFSKIYFWAVRIKWIFSIVPIIIIPITFIYGLYKIIKLQIQNRAIKK